MLGVPFLALFFSLRGLVDAITSRPYHTYNLFIALAVGIAGFILSSAVLPRGSTALGIAVSGFVALAIVKYGSDSEVYLFYCNEDWEAVTDTCHASVGHAIEQAQFEFGPLRFTEA